MRRLTKIARLLLVLCGLGVGPFCRAAAAADLYVAEYGWGKILKFAPDGTRSTFATGLTNATAVAFDSGGNLFVTTVQGGGIYKIAPEGTVSLFAAEAAPYGLAFDGSDNLFVTDLNARCIYRYAPDGSRSVFTTNVGSQPRWLAFDRSGNLFEADGTVSPYGAIYKFAPDGTRSTFASGLDTPIVLAFDGSDNLFVGMKVSSIAGICKFTPDGSQSTFSSGGGVRGLAFDAGGNLFATDNSSNIYKFAPDGTRSTFASGLVNPVGLAFAPVPEPSTFVLLGMGAVGLLGFAWRRRRVTA